MMPNILRVMFSSHTTASGFNEGQAPAPGVTTRARPNEDDEEDEDDDIAVSRATISTKCPLTLQEFKQPLSSKKCPHSFESEAILSMLSTSNAREGGRPNGKRVVQCPVTGCAQELSREDLHKDAVLIRQIKRIQRAKQLEQEEQDDDDGPVNRRSTQDGPTIIGDGSEDGEDVDDIVDEPTQIKAQQSSAAGVSHPAPTAGRNEGNMMDLSGVDDEDEGRRRGRRRR